MLKSSIEKDYTDIIDEFKKKHTGISVRQLNISNTEVYVLYLPQITDRDKLSECILKPLLQGSIQNTTKKEIQSSTVQQLSIEKIAYSMIYVDDIQLSEDISQIQDYVLKGKSIILIKSMKQFIIANTTKVQQRSVNSPDLDQTLRGPRDSFTENTDTNLSLIRYRIKDSQLRIEPFTVGKRTKTSVSVIYIEDVVNPKYVEEIRKRIEKINIDGILESSYIQNFILNHTFDMFPQAGITESSDIVAGNLLEGKVCILVEGSPIVLILPKVFVEFFDSSDDHYNNLYISIFTKLIRIFSFFTSLTASSLYVAVVSFHPDILPAQYILALAISRGSVPFNALTEAVIMELVAELLKEASIRLPKQIGPAIGIVGTIVIGQAAVQAKLVSPLMVIVVALVTMSSLVAPDYTIMNPVRIYKFMLLFLTGILGLYGFTMGMTVIFINLISTNSLGTAYTAPLAPLNFVDLKNYILSNISLRKRRPEFLKTKDDTRQ